MDAGTATPLGEPKESGMSDVPTTVKILDIPICERNLMPLPQVPEGMQDSFWASLRKVTLRTAIHVRNCIE